MTQPIEFKCVNEVEKTAGLENIKKWMEENPLAVATGGLAVGGGATALYNALASDDKKHKYRRNDILIRVPTTIGG